MERPYPLAGVLVCGSCGSQMTPHYVMKKNRVRVPYYRCTATFKQSWTACTVKHVNADKVEAWVASLLEELATSPAVTEQAVAQANAARAGDVEPLREQERALEARLREHEARMERVPHRTVTPSPSWPRPVTWWSHRTSMSCSAAIRSSRIFSVRDWEMLTNGGNGERPASANV